MENPDVFCRVGTGGQWIPSNMREYCLEIGGTIEDPGAIDPTRGTGICFVRDVLTKALSERILRLGGTYQLAVDFRDEILRKTPVGRPMLQHYYKHVPDIFAAVARDPQILAMALEAWQATWLIAQAMLLVKRGERPNSGERDPARVILPVAQHRAIAKLAQRLVKGSKDMSLR